MKCIRGPDLPRKLVAGVQYEHKGEAALSQGGDENLWTFASLPTIDPQWLSIVFLIFPGINHINVHQFDHAVSTDRRTRSPKSKIIMAIEWFCSGPPNKFPDPVSWRQIDQYRFKCKVFVVVRFCF